jgi:uncharacterized protein YdhG (YjbR/CyaY superfamily)
MRDAPQPASIDDYLAGFPPAVRERLGEIRTIVREVAPQATERISYAIPTFDVNGKHLVHFAGFNNHIGFYPTPSAIEAFSQELTGYKSAKGSVQFPLSKPLPRDLIRRMVEFRVNEMDSEASR